MTQHPLVVISILNWNSAEITLNCINSILALDRISSHRTEIIVIDNGSEPEDWNTLQRGIRSDVVSLLRQECNQGFAGGHNIAIKTALDKQAEYIWLVNSDAIIPSDTLTKLIAVMEVDSSCGAVSPVIKALHDPAEIDFCGAMHDWKKFESINCKTIAEARIMETQHPRDMWVLGTAPLLRMAALREIGMLDEKLFAYYEDNDLCARLSHANWISRMAFDAEVLHERSRAQYQDRPAYYFYLMARNSFHFWCKHTPKPYRRFIRLKLADRNILTANRLFSKGLKEKTSACLLGVYDGLLGRTGVWNLRRRTPALMAFLRKILWNNHVHHLEGH